MFIAPILFKRAYPRSHGATAITFQGICRLTGLSPLARGNRAWPNTPGPRSGPIPARTGQPNEMIRAITAARAYPRSHGATRTTLIFISSLLGLSPLARGNLVGEPLHYPAGGPIPARTGQPRRTGTYCPRITAYPRSHGATAPAAVLALIALGLSPLARGNLTEHAL